MIEVTLNYELVLTLISMLVIAITAHLTKSILFKVILFVLAVITTVHFINTAPNQTLLSYIVLSSITDDINTNTHTYAYTTNALYTISYELVLIIVFTYMTFMLYKVYSAIRHMLA
ncbi:MAG: hypothetical protein QXO37_09355 [Candidatus Nitrosocaldaceae archaeon]